MDLLWLAASTIVIGVFGCVAWFWGSNWVLDAIYPPRGPNAGDNIRRANVIRPWLFLGPAILFLSLYLVYPVLGSFWASLHNASGSEFVGANNYIWLLGDAKFWESMRNNMFWLLVVPALSTLFGLLAAQLTDLAARSMADELMVSTMTHGADERLDTLRIVAEVLPERVERRPSRTT